MTYKDKEVQPEFFCPAKKNRKPSIFGNTVFSQNYQWSFTITFDTLVVLLITGLMVILASFVVGIERGKKTALISPGHSIAAIPDNTVQAEAEQKNSVSEVSVPPVNSPAAEQASVTSEQKPAAVAVTEKGYIIQLVTYSSDAPANEEIQRLKATGIPGFVLKSGKYFIVCSGIYNSKITAVQKLSNFKKRYKDCFVRFLERT